MQLLNAAETNTQKIPDWMQMAKENLHAAILQGQSMRSSST